MAAKSYYKYFQPNKLDLKDQAGDCAIRAVCKAEEIDWLEAYDLMYKYSRVVQSPMNCKYGFEACMKAMGYYYTGVSNKKGTKRPTVKQMAKQYPDKTIICIVSNHYVTCRDGYYHDIWDSGDKPLYGYWEKSSP